MPGCGDSKTGPDTPQVNDQVKASVQTITAPAEGLATEFTVTSTGEWDAVASQTWVKLTKTGTTTTAGRVGVTVDANGTTEARTADITLMSGRNLSVVKVEQAAKAPDPLPDVPQGIDVPEGYEMVWNDEFDTGTVPDPAKWRHEVQGSGWVNNELQNYVNGEFGGRRVTEVADGILTITAFKKGGKVYSGRIYGNESKGWTYGIFEARIKLPKGKGTWPAFWMMPANNDFGTTPWPDCGEIDIMEEVGVNPNRTSSSIHCKDYNHVKGTQKTAERLTEGAEDEFHVYRLEWTEDYIRTYVDGHKLLQFNNDGRGNKATWPFDRPFYLILNLAWGGNWGGMSGVDESALPATYQIDYVRVFQKKK